MKQKTCGIYVITNTINGKRYIGQAIDIEQRWENHQYKLGKGTHRNQHLQYAWIKYGAESFIHHVIEECEESLLDEREAFWINETPEGNRYNILLLPGQSRRGIRHSAESRVKMSAVQMGHACSTESRAKMSFAARNRSPETLAKIGAASKGRVPSAETREKIGAAARNISPETRAKLSAASTGRTHTAEARAKMSAASKGHTLGPEARAKIGSAHRGLKHTAEARAKISAAHRGHKVSAETRARMSAAQKGRTHSTETLAKMSAAQKGRAHSEETRAKIGTAQKWRTGEFASKAKLTWADIDVIRELLAQGVSQTEIAKRFSVTKPTIGSIAHNKSWVKADNNG